MAPDGATRQEAERKGEVKMDSWMWWEGICRKKKMQRTERERERERDGGG